MDSKDVLIEAYDRLPPLVAGTLENLSPEQLRWAPVEGANTIGWLIWHLTRVMDYSLEALGETQSWATGNYAEKFDLPPDPTNTGFGHQAEQIAEIRPHDTAALTDYFTTVHRRTTEWIAPLTDTDLDRIIDKAWDPPVTLGARLVSILLDATQHVGQAAYLRGIHLNERRPAGVQPIPKNAPIE